MAGYRPMTLADLAGYLSRAADDRTRWKLTWEFLEEYRWESSAVQPSLLRDEPPGTGDERWDALLAALAEHLAAQHDLAPPEWAELRVLQRPWFPAELKVQRADALVRAGRIPQARGLLVRCGPGSSVTEPGGVLLDRVQLERAFTALGERLVRRGVVADVFVVGGAAIQARTTRAGAAYSTIPACG